MSDIINAFAAEATGETSPLKRALRKVLEEPQNNFYRQHYADELDAVGETERAEFIRVHCAIANDECLQEVELARLQNRFEELLNATNAEAWRKGFMRNNCWAWFTPFIKGYNWDRNKIACGFAFSIECTLASFIGGECDRCHGSGRDDLPGRDNCDDCEGTGRSTGLVNTLFAEHPVTEVVLTDRVPNQEEGSQAFWMTDDQANYSGTWESYLPAELFNELTGYTEINEEVSQRWIVYPTLEAAFGAVSRACVALGRKRAGLGVLV